MGRYVHSMERTLIQRILRVNHAGEHGAVAIYGRQLARAKQRFPDLTPWIEETLGHEMTHRTRFFEAMPERGAKPCRLMSVWGVGGAVLGLITGLFGRQGIYACTAAVERTVHAHLIEQIGYLQRTDPELADLVTDILREEDEHLAHAEANIAGRTILVRVLEPIIAAATEVMIFLSTRGDSLRLRKALGAA